MLTFCPLFSPRSRSLLLPAPALQDRRAEEGQEGDVEGRPQGQEGADGEEEARSPVGRRGRVLDLCALSGSPFGCPPCSNFLPFSSCHLPSTRILFWGQLWREKAARSRVLPYLIQTRTGSAHVVS